ncbi:MAG: DUF883 family protein [Planctomycetaceae bacterium]|nr:DUF883 family protein [Planctomycetaceae bacterium]
MTVTKQALEGNWNELKGRLQDRWGQLTDDDLMRARGNANELIGLIQKKTGAARKDIEGFLEDVVANGASAFQAVKDSARDYSQQASEAMHAGYDQVAESVRTGYEQAEGMVRSRPVESIAVAFGAGIITGVILGVVLKPR